MNWRHVPAIVAALGLAIGGTVAVATPGTATPLNVWDNVDGGVPADATYGYGQVLDLILDGDRLIIGGNFTSVKGGALPAGRVAIYDTVAKEWDTLAGGVTGGGVAAMALYQGDLVVAGSFTAAGGVTANKLAVYDFDTSTWAQFGGGVDSNGVYALAANGTDLYVGGDFWGLGGASVDQVARWDGSQWNALGSGLGATSGVAEVRDFAISGTDVYVAGKFSTAGGVSTQGAAKWNGSTWSSLGTLPTGVEPTIKAVAVDGEGTVWLGGTRGLSTWDGTTRTVSSVVSQTNDVSSLTWNPDAGLLMAFNGSYITPPAAPLLVQQVARYKDGTWSAFTGPTDSRYYGSGTGINIGNTNIVTKIVGNATDVYAAGTFASAGSYTPKTAGLARFGPIVGTIPAMTSASITGSPSVGSKLTATPNSRAGTPAVTFYYWWSKFDDTLGAFVYIPGATLATFTPDASLVGVRVQVTVRAINNNGASAMITTDAVTIGATGKLPKVASASIAGKGDLGQTLTARHGAVTGKPKPKITYQWQQSLSGAWRDIVGARTAKFTISGAQQGASVRVVVTATNAAGTGSATSKAVKIAAPEPPAPGKVSASTMGRSITLTWTAAQGAEVTEYAGLCSRKDVTVRSTAGAGKRSLTIEATSSGTWKCRVAAITPLGRGGSDRIKVSVS